MSNPMTVVTSISAAITMAVSSLALGDHEEAGRLLQKILLTLKGSIPPHDQEKTTTEQARRIHSKVDFVQGLCQSSAGQEAIPDGAFAFSDRFYLIPSSWDAGFRSEDDVSFLSSVTLHNLGMVRHQIAMRTGHSSELVKALRMYAFAMSSLENIPHHRHTAATVRVFCSLYNNMGHAYEQLGSFQASQCCLKRLLNLLEEVQRCSLRSDMLSEEDYDFYYQYMGMRFTNGSFCASPAA